MEGWPIKDQSLLLRLKVLNNMILREIVTEGGNFELHTLKQAAEWNSRVINNLVEVLLNEGTNQEPALKAAVTQMRIAVNAMKIIEKDTINNKEDLVKEFIL
ncbi:hypothetical protein CVD28_15435 [Bacillus sp. M6-12]|uniref:hypothetical protein n=1 Tax=Bacillus sp. M6-12 TaxID=2054166 RepID=UPI000C790C89|nr:hypothetical protein [Bacillus sp. M6-12]PLS16480.1 hypothetical protein CVD28_15435 [Bacillus sp. M6-12]